MVCVQVRTWWTGPHDWQPRDGSRSRGAARPLLLKQRGAPTVADIQITDLEDMQRGRGGLETCR